MSTEGIRRGMHDPMEEPFAEETDLHHFITQETRYLIVQYILAHPENLPSLEELDHAIPKGRSTIHEHIGRLQERGLVDAYELEPEKRSRDRPSTFHGLTEYGIYVVEELGLLDARGMLQAIYANMDKPEKIRRYEDAPRPERKSEADLSEDLDDLVADDDRDPGRADTMQEIAGITNLLVRERSAGLGADESVPVRLELGAKILDLLDSESAEDREAAVSALARIARANVEAVVPVLPKLANLVSDLGMERQLGVSEIFRHVSESEPDLVSEEIRETLLGLYDRDLEHWQDDFDVARETLKAGLSVGENVGADALRRTCHERLGDIARRTGNLDEAEEHYLKSLATARDIGDRHGEAETLGNLGVVVQRGGDLDAAEEYHQQSLDIKRDIDDRHGEAMSLNNLGAAAGQRGDLDAAEEYLCRSLDIKRDIGDRRGEAMSLGNLGVVAVHREDHERARSFLARAFELHVDIGATTDALKTAESLARLAARQDEYAEAVSWCEEGLELIEESTSDFPEATDALRSLKEEFKESSRPDRTTRDHQERLNADSGAFELAS